MINAIIFDWIGTLYRRNTGLFEGVEELLKSLKPKYKLGLVSLAGQGIDNRRNDIKSTGIWDYFDSIRVDTSKDEEQFLRCIKEMNTLPRNTLIIGDRTIREIKIGNKLGCQTYWIKNGDYANQLPTQETGKPTKIITSVHDILKYL